MSHAVRVPCTVIKAFCNDGGNVDLFVCFYFCYTGMLFGCRVYEQTNKQTMTVVPSDIDLLAESNRVLH
jgi:hypothetical protein